MSIKQMAELTKARLAGASGLGSSSPAARRGFNGANKAAQGASVTWMWYRHPERLMSQSGPPPS